MEEERLLERRCLMVLSHLLQSSGQISLMVPGCTSGAGSNDRCNRTLSHRNVAVVGCNIFVAFNTVAISDKAFQPLRTVNDATSIGTYNVPLKNRWLDNQKVDAGHHYPLNCRSGIS